MSKRSRDDSSEEHDDGMNFIEPGFEFSESDDELLGDLTQEFLEDEENLIGEISQGFVEATQVFRNLPLYYQVGSGFENQPGPSSAGSVFVEGVPAPVPSKEVKNAIVLTPLHQRTYQTYRANEAFYQASIDIDRIPDYLRERPLIAAVEAVRELFGTLMQRTFESLAPMDLVRFCIQAEGLDKPISSHLQRVDAFTLEKLLAIVLKVLQSKDKIKLVDGFVVDIITVKRDVGAGVDRKVINVQVNKVCRLHFNEGDIITHAEGFHEKTGEKIPVLLHSLKLREGALPEIFPNNPKYMTKRILWRERIRRQRK